MAVPLTRGRTARATTRRAGSLSTSWHNLSLYRRVVAVNTVILLLAVLALVLTPVTVSFPVAAGQGLVLVTGAVVMAMANAALLRLNFRGLGAVVRRMETVDVLRPQHDVPSTGGPEAKALIAGFNTMLARLEAERRASTRRTLDALEGERRRIGLELHDEIGQRLTGTLLQLNNLGEDLPQSFKQPLEVIKEQQRATLDEVGALAWQLRPALLDDLGLRSALVALGDALREHAVMEMRLHLQPSLPRLAPELELVVYRIAQEALTNAVRHSKASRVALRLALTDRRLSLEVLDDGRGLDADASEGPGIRGMRERALLVGGHLSVVNHPGPRPGVGVRLVIERPSLGAA